MESEENKLLEVLDKIVIQQKEISDCHDYYQKLEKALDQRRKRLANSEDLSSLTQEIAILNREYEEKTDLMFEDLNASLLKGHDLSKKIGNEIAHDFKQLWDYMTDAVHQEVDFEKVLKEINRIKKHFLL